MIAVVRSFWLLLTRSRGKRDLEPADADNVGRLREPPIMLAEVIAASSILDFGGIPDARHFHALYDWRLSEAEKYSAGDSSREGRRGHGSVLQCPKRNFQGRL
jgi:hypothetical protein